jgi:nucleoside recognition membrane protein YjiH
MASALAYQQPARRSREQEQLLHQPSRQVPRRPLRVLPGTGVQAASQQGIAPLWRALFITVVAVALMIGAVLVVRVSLVNATMELLADTAQTVRMTEAARAEGTQLEVRYAIVSNPASIQDAAASELGMSPDPRVDYLKIPSGE